MRINFFLFFVTFLWNLQTRDIFVEPRARCARGGKGRGVIVVFVVS